MNHGSSQNVMVIPSAPTGWRRAASWLYDVVNPIARLLESDVSFLSKYSLGWSEERKDLANVGLMPLRSRLTADGALVYDDFVRACRETELAGSSSRGVQDAFRGRDEAARSLREAIMRLSEAIRSLTDFYDVLRGPFKEAAKRTEYCRHLVSAEEEDLVSAVVERIINGDGRHSKKHIPHGLWDEVLPAFSVVYAATEDERAALKQEKASFIEASESAGKKLKDVSFDLCGIYDLPAAPSAFSLTY